MMILSEEQLNSLNKEALIILVSSLQDQLGAMQNQLSETNRQIELLTEQIKLMNQRKFGKSSESQIEGQLSFHS